MKKRPVAKKKAPPFKKALYAARAVLSAKKQRRAVLIIELDTLNHEIPALEKTVQALEQQLNGKKIDRVEVYGVTADKRVTDKPVQVIPGDEIPPEIRAQLPPEDMSKFGSHFGTEPPEQEDFLPEIDGDDPTKAKGKVAKD